MTPIAASTFMEVVLGSMLVIPMMILWAAAVYDVVRQADSGLKIAAILVLVLIVPILGPILYFAFRPARVSAEDAYLAQADQRRETAARAVTPRV